MWHADRNTRNRTPTNNGRPGAGFAPVQGLQRRITQRCGVLGARGMRHGPRGFEEHHVACSESREVHRGERRRTGIPLKVACARKRILASVGPVQSPRYLGRLRRGIHFDALFDLGFAPQEDYHSEVSDVPYHFVFNGPTREQEPLAQEPPNQVERTIPWVLVGPRSDRNRDLLGALFEHEIDPGGSAC